jgi:predicted acyltransferase
MDISATLPQGPKRLRSLDVFRGLTVMFMIFVNNGAGGEIFSTLQHSKWNGMTPCDLVFPFFIFIMGVSTYLSLKKTQFKWSKALVWKILKRTVLLFLIGLFINWFDLACSGNPFDFAHLRIMGVMQRLGLCYGATALLAMAAASLSKEFGSLPVIIVAILVVYGALLLTLGGYDYDSTTNFLAIADRNILGPDHLYHKSPVDPEGLVSTLSAISQTLIGFYIAYLAFGPKRSLKEKILVFLTAGAILTLLGYLLSFGLPLNKRIWSPSYVLVTCGFASLLLGLFTLAIDRQGTTTPAPEASRRTPHWQVAFLIFGSNPLLLYVVSELLAIIFGYTAINMAIYNVLHGVITSGYWASVAYAALFVAFHALIGYPLWKRHIYIKI